MPAGKKFKTKVVDNAGIQKQFNIIKGLLIKAEMRYQTVGDAAKKESLLQRWAVMHQAYYTGESQRSKAVCGFLPWNTGRP